MLKESKIRNEMVKVQDGLNGFLEPLEYISMRIIQATLEWVLEDSQIPPTGAVTEIVESERKYV